MKSGMGEQLMNLYNYKGNGRVNYLSIALNVSDAINERPCAFDDIGERIVNDNLTKSRYDSEIDGQMSFDDFPEVMQ